MKKTVSLRKQLSRIITMCCIIVACVQAIVMAAMIMKQYIVHEKENTLFLLKSNNEMVGFDDVSYFSRVFRKYEDCSPREYESRLRGKKRKAK